MGKGRKYGDRPLFRVDVLVFRVQGTFDSQERPFRRLKYARIVLLPYGTPAFSSGTGLSYQTDTGLTGVLSRVGASPLANRFSLIFS